MHLADSSVWLLIVCMMATLNIKKPLDENGKVVEPNHTFNNSIFRLVCYKYLITLFKLLPTSNQDTLFISMRHTPEVREGSRTNQTVRDYLN